MDNKLIIESLKEQNSFSSNQHGIDTITQDSNSGTLNNYDIPHRYNKIKLVLLPINKKKFYFYWEFTNQFLTQNMVELKDITFHIIDENHNLISIIDCKSEYGQYFYLEEHDVKYIKVIAIYKKGTLYKKLLDSNSVKVLNDEIKPPSDDVWIDKKKGFTEVIRASLSHFTLGMSSKNYVDELESLKEYDRLSKKSYSSHNLGGDR
ncbi:MAG: DUF4912 domain-containing protein [Campylobacterota bacterium]|nr:DUF4912 domain-containing protein [Campylobacterota bacterium]